MRTRSQYISICLLLLYAALTVVGAGHGTHSHCVEDQCHSHSPARTNPGAHTHPGDSCDHEHANPESGTQLSALDPHQCLLCNWLGQAQSDEVAYGEFVSQRITRSCFIAAAQAASQPLVREALPRGPPILS